MDTPQQRFLLSILPNTDQDGRVLGFHIQHTNQSVPQEIILTFIRTWLREMEDAYYQKFKSS